MKLEELTLESLERYCIPAPELKLQRRDVLGVKTGARYDPTEFGVVRKFRIGTAGFTQNTRGGHHHVFLGTLADKLDVVLKTSRWVDTVQCNYPVVIPKQRPPRSDKELPFYVVVVDRMLTVALRERPDEPHLHALFLNDQRRDKAAAFLARYGVSCERIHPEQFPRLALSNAAQCYQWIMRLDDIRPLRPKALAFSQDLLALPRTRSTDSTNESTVTLEDSLDTVMTHIASIVVHIPVDDAYILLAVAIIFGYLNLDPDKRLATMEPLGLA